LSLTLPLHEQRKEARGGGKVLAKRRRGPGESSVASETFPVGERKERKVKEKKEGRKRKEDEDELSRACRFGGRGTGGREKWTERVEELGGNTIFFSR